MFNLLLLITLHLIPIRDAKWETANLEIGHITKEKELERIIELHKKHFITNLVTDPELIYSYQLNLFLGRVYLNLEQYKQAHRHFKNALRLANFGSDSGLALYYLGRTFLFEGKFDSAAKYFSRVLDYNPNPDLNFLYDYGITLFKIERDEDAFSTLNNLYQQLQLLRADKNGLQKSMGWRGNYNELLTLLGLLALKTGKTDQAVFFLELIPAAERGYSILEANYLLALSYFKNGHWQKAESLLESQKVPSPSTLKQKIRLLLGIVQFESGKNELALKTFTAIIQDTIRLHQDYAYLVAGFILYKSKRYEAAIEHLNTLAKKFPDSDLVEYGLFYLSQIYQELKSYRLAIEKKQELTKRFPKSKFLETTVLEIGKLYYKERSFANAFRELNAYLKLFPKSPHRAEALYLSALSGFEIKEESLAQDLLKQLVDSFPKSPYSKEAFYRLGTIELARHQFELAKNYFSKVDSGRFYPYSLKGIGDAYRGLARYDSAELYYLRAESVLTRPNWIDYSDTLLADIRFGKETAKLNLRKYTSYIEMLKSYLASYPSSYLAPKLQFEIGLYHYEKHNFMEAIAEFHKVFNYTPNESIAARTHLFIGRSYLNSGQIETAIWIFDYIITNFSCPTSVIVALNSLAEIHTKNLAYDSAINCYLKIIENYPFSQEAQSSLLNIARLYRKLGKTLEAKLTLDRLLKEYPKSELHKSAYLEMISLVIDEGDLPYAETLVNHLHKKSGANPSTTLLLGKIRSEQNRFKEAKELFLTASQLLKGDEKAEALILASHASISLNDTNEAKYFLKQAEKATDNEQLKIKCQELFQKLR